MVEELVATRRVLHKNAQLSFEETFAAELVRARLTALGLEPLCGLGAAPPEFEGAGPAFVRPEQATGITCIIKGKFEGPRICLRADMDALPITEVSDLPYCSQNDGCMHACGHDGHVAILLTTAKILGAFGRPAAS